MPINLASGKETSIKDLAEIIKKQMNYKGDLRWDSDMPTGPNRRNVSIDLARKKIKFNPKVSLEDGIKKTIDSFMSSKKI